MNPARAGLVLGRRWGPAAAPRAEARGGWEVGPLGEQNLSFEIFAEEFRCVHPSFPESR